MSGLRARAPIVGAAVVLGVLLVLVVANSLPWIGRTFPGFMLMANRVVPSIALPHWSEGRAPQLFQSQVVAVDGSAVRDAGEIYDRVASSAPGHLFSYELRDPFGGGNRTETIRSQVFGPRDYVYLFGAYLLNGLVFMAIGLLVVWLEPRAPASRGLAVAVLSTGVFVTTATDLYGPHWFFRLHVVAEAFMGAGFVHLALVFPTDRLGERRGRVLRPLYAVAAVFAVAYELCLDRPTLYTIAHLGALAGQVLGCAAMIGAFVWDYLRSGSPLVRRRIQVVTIGVTAGMILPLGMWAMSAAAGGSVSMNWAALTAFLFPLSFAYAVVQQDLFEIDVVVRRAAIYTAVVVSTVALYVTVFGALNWALGARGGLEDHPVLLVIVNVAVLFAIAPLRAQIQDAVDGVFFRRGYDPQETVQRLGHGLERALYVGEVVAETRRVLQETFWPRRCLLLAYDESDRLAALPGQDEALELCVPRFLCARLAAGEVLTRYEWEERPGPDRDFWVELGAELMVPVLRDEGLESVVALGRKESGRAYNVHDSAVLRTMSGQISLAMATARAFGELRDLNASLEQQVQDRTAELAVANTGLRASLAKLEQNQQSLMRADRLATLGRLAAGIAHEVNTPLGAVLNSLQILKDLGREYEDSIRDAQVSADDHAEIAGEILKTVGDAESWAQRAATYVSRMKSQGREPGTQDRRRFRIGEVVTEVEGLLSHRLRACDCRIDVDEASSAVELLGDPSRLTHVLMNVVDNAIGAYENHPDPDGRIEVRARRSGGVVTLEVRDHAGGVPDEIADRIFDELFTTKERGKGTGLGLWIARNVVERSFGGSLDLVPAEGRGACFVAVLRDALAEVPPRPRVQESAEWEAEDSESRP